MHSTEKKALALNLLLSLLMAAGYMLLFAYNNTPLGAAIGSDNAMYLTMGTALAKGWAPYVDVFDHKGPLLFALQGLPQWIGGGYNLTAVFLQEVVALFACLTVVRALARALSCPPVWAQLVYLAMTCAFMDGGNLTEEYTNLPTLLALYMALRVFGQEKISEKLFLPAAGMGVCAAAAFSLRANNALPIFALVAVLAAGLAITQRFAQLGQCAAGFTLGLLAVFLPILIWLAAKGALSAAWYGAIIHNMMYADSGTGDRFAALFTTSYGHMAMIIAAFACAGALAVWKKRRAPLLALAMLAAAAAGGLAAFLSRKFYIHYLMLGAPLAAVGAMAVVRALRQPRAQKAAALTLAAVSALWLGISGVSANAARLSVRFFLRDSFGKLMENVNAHYARLEIAGAKYSILPLWALLNATVRDSKKQVPSPVVSGATVRAVFSGTPYPVSLMEAVLLRIRAERNVTWERAAILKAYLAKNYERGSDHSMFSEVTSVRLNEDCNYMPYLLGRLFRVMEEIQLASMGWSVNRSIRDSYFNSAASTPRSVFGKLFSLSNYHLKKLMRDKPGLGKKLGDLESDLAARLTTPPPARFTQEETICFYLGYYHQCNGKKEEKENV